MKDRNCFICCVLEATATENAALSMCCSKRLQFLPMDTADNFLSGKNQSAPGNPLAAYSDITQDVTSTLR